MTDFHLIVLPGNQNIGVDIKIIFLSGLDTKLLSI